MAQLHQIDDYRDESVLSSHLLGLTEAERRRVLEGQTRRARAVALRGLVRLLSPRVLAAIWRAWRTRQAVARELLALGDHGLDDLGLKRTDVQAMAEGRYHLQPKPARPARAA